MSVRYIYTMESSNIGNRIVHYGIPFFICIYFFTALYPKYIGNNEEIIPFSLFKLYSLVPYDYIYYDMMIIGECGESEFLFYKNEDLSRVERKYLLRWFREIGNTYEETNEIRIDSNHHFIKSIKGDVYLVRLKGDYIETFDKGIFDLEILKRVK